MTINSSPFRVMLTMAATMAAVIFFARAADAATSNWDVNEGGRMRLVALAPDADGRIRAALQIEPKPGWITYWREPGESGIPPQVSTAPGDGLALERIAYPAPKPIAIGAIREIGYDGPVTLPLDFRATGNGEPARLDISAFIGFCREICIPFQAAFSLPLAAAGETLPEEEAVLDAADAALPKAPSPDFSIQDHALSPDGKILSLTLRLPQAASEAPQIYVTGPSGYVFFKRANDRRDGRDFQTDIAIGRLPKNYDIHGKSWKVLAVDGGHAMEATLAFD